MPKDNIFSRVPKTDSEPYAPSTTRTIPYGHQYIDEEDIQAVVEVLRSDWLTTGPKVAEFEKALAGLVEAKEAVAVSSGTAALHAAMYAIDIGPGDEVILPPMTFVATANAVVFQGGTPIFADVDPDTLLIDPNQVEDRITQNTKAIVAVDYAGHPCDYDALRTIAARHGLFLVADACHSLGAEYKGRKVGTLADLTVFSFHPVKHITTGEGGMIVTDNTVLASKMRRFRNHGIDTDHRKRADQDTWYYEMEDLGYNYRISDIQCALGISQLRKLPTFLKQRRKIAAIYDAGLGTTPGVQPLGLRSDVVPAKDFAECQIPSVPRGVRSSSDAKLHACPVESEGHSVGTPVAMPSFSNSLRHRLRDRLSIHAYHLYVVKVDSNPSSSHRATVFQSLRAMGIAVNVHYIPVQLQPFYRNRFGTGPGLCPVAEGVYEQIISLPIFAGMHDSEVHIVLDAVSQVTGR